MNVRSFSALFVSAALVAGVLAQDGGLGRNRGSGRSGESTEPSKSEPSKKQSGSTATSRSSGSNTRSSQDSSRSNAGLDAQIRSRLQGDPLGRNRPPSRSGRVNYGTTNNFSRIPQGDYNRLSGPPTVRDLDERRRSMGSMVRREDNVRILRDGVRVGYSHWDSRWRDDHFSYPHYVFSPYTTSCVVSPWYYYVQLPGYILSTRTIYVGSGPLPFHGYEYNWRRPEPDYWGRRREMSELDYALDDIVSAFESGDPRAVNRLVPRGGTVTVSVDGRILYGLHADDFYDMFVDAIESARTVNYQIMDVQVNDDEAQIVARHEFRDSWGSRSVVYHQYRLQIERGHGVIRYFSTSPNRYW